MPNEKIETGYRHIGTFANVEYHHKFLLYTDKNGKQYTISGRTDEYNQNSLLPFGNIRIQANGNITKTMLAILETMRIHFNPLLSVRRI